MCRDCTLRELTHAARRLYSPRYYTDVSLDTQSLATAEYGWLERQAEHHLVHPAVLDMLWKLRDNSDYTNIAGSIEYQSDSTKTLLNAIALEWPHVSEKDPLRIAYTRSPEHGKADRQTVTSLGKYINRLFPMFAGHEIEQIVDIYKNKGKVTFEMVSDSNLIDAMYDTTAYSCMTSINQYRTKEQHPYLVYAERLGWKLAVKRNHSGVPITRCLVNNGHFVRIYGTDDSGNGEYRTDDPALRDWLESQGVTRAASWSGLRILKIYDPGDDSNLLGPYFDGEAVYCDDNGDGTLSIGFNGDYSARETNGILQDQGEDEHDGQVETVDGDWIDEDDSRVDYAGDIRHEDSVRYVESEGEYYPRDEVVRLVNGDWGVRSDCIRINDCWYTDEEIVSDYNNEDRIMEYCITLTCGEFDGEYALESETVCTADGEYALRSECSINADGNWVLTSEPEEKEKEEMEPEHVQS